MNTANGELEALLLALAALLKDILAVVHSIIALASAKRLTRVLVT